MKLGKTNVDNSVNHVPKSDQTRELKPNRIKKNSLTRKQNKNLSKNNKKLIKNIAAGRFGILK